MKKDKFKEVRKLEGSEEYEGSKLVERIIVAGILFASGLILYALLGWLAGAGL